MDWPQLHAALNDLPPALLLVAVLFEAAGALVRRESLRAAGYWTLIAGVVGTGLAIGAGLMAEDVVQHSEAAHEVMERHETLAFVVLGIFAVMLLWRLVRRTMSRGETTAYVVLGVVGIGVLVATAHLGGRLVFEHGLGIRTARLSEIQQERQAAGTGEAHHHEEEEAGHEGTGAQAPPAN